MGSLLPRISNLALGIGVLSCVLITGCPRDLAGATTTSPVGSTSEGVLGPLDVIEVRVCDEEELTNQYQIEADGTLHFPYVGTVMAAGLTPGGVADLLVDKLSPEYLRRPTVTIRVLQANSRRVVVLGFVKSPGSLPFVDGMTVIQALAQVGGVSEDSAANQTRVTRIVDGEQVIIRVPVIAITGGRAIDVALLPDDVIYVPESPI